jgi:hypothetical protein
MNAKKYARRNSMEKGQPPKQSHVTESRRLLKRLP